MYTIDNCDKLREVENRYKVRKYEIHKRRI